MEINVDGATRLRLPVSPCLLCELGNFRVRHVLQNMLRGHLERFVLDVSSLAGGVTNLVESSSKYSFLVRDFLNLSTPEVAVLLDEGLITLCRRISGKLLLCKLVELRGDILQELSDLCFGPELLEFLDLSILGLQGLDGCFQLLSKSATVGLGLLALSLE